jgi:hypothetical protein
MFSKDIKAITDMIVIKDITWLSTTINMIIIEDVT